MRSSLGLALVLGACSFNATGGGDGTTTDGHGPTPDSGSHQTGSDGGGAHVDARPPDAMVPPDAKENCPGDFQVVAGANPGSRYKAFDKTTAGIALATCGSVGGNVHLVELDDDSETQAIYAFIDNKTGAGDSHQYHVDGAKIAGFWVDHNFTPLAFQPWGQNQPATAQGDNCVLLQPDSGGGTQPAVFAADQCPSQHEFACECEE